VAGIIRMRGRLHRYRWPAWFGIPAELLGLPEEHGVARVSTAARLAPTDGPRLRAHVSSAVNLHQVGGPQVAPLAVPLKAIPKKRDRASQFSIKKELDLPPPFGRCRQLHHHYEAVRLSRRTGYVRGLLPIRRGIERLTRA